jgi:hypothetical protein
LICLRIFYLFVAYFLGVGRDDGVKWRNGVLGDDQITVEKVEDQLLVC